jgi:hypothetical protein
MFERPATAECSVTDSGVLRVPRRVREHYLTPEAGNDSCLVQASGSVLHVWFWSDRGCIRLDVQLTEFRVGPPLERSVNRWGVNVNRWRDALDVTEGSVDASIETFTGDRP